MWSLILLTLAVLIITYVIKALRSPLPNRTKYYVKYTAYFVLAMLNLQIWPLFLLRPRNTKNARLGAIIYSTVSRWLGFSGVIRNASILDEDHGAVVVVNHQCSLDILATSFLIESGRNIVSSGKKMMFPIGAYAYLSGSLIVDKDNRKQAYENLFEFGQRLTKEKAKLIMFPEGTRNRDLPQLLPFKKGAFALAIKFQLPVIPVVFAPYYSQDRKRGVAYGKTEVIMECLEPIPTTGLTEHDVTALANQVRDIMQKKYNELIKEVVAMLPKDYKITVAHEYAKVIDIDSNTS